MLSSAGPSPVVAAGPGVGPVAVIEDDPLVMHALVQLLSSEGHVVVAGPRLEGVLPQLQCQRRPPVLILADYWLGRGQTGIEAVRRLRREFGPAIPALVLTGDTSAQPRDEAQAHQCRLLVKPVLPDDLLDTIRTLNRR